MTLQEATRLSTDQLKTIYAEGEAAAISDWIMEHLTGVKKTHRIGQLKKTLSEEQVSLLQAFLERLCMHEPVQYILNEAWFCGLKFFVDKRVLIPRPETEELVEWIISNCKFPVDQLRILDIGSGSGCIPIALKRRIGKAEVWSCDSSHAALQVAMQNADRLGAQVNFTAMDFLSAEQRDRLPVFDIIVSNPPYIPHQERYQMQPNVLEYEPYTALFVPDNDPLIFYKAIAAFGKKHLAKNGSIYVELHENGSPAIQALLQANGYTAEVKKDMQGKERMIKAQFRI